MFDKFNLLEINMLQEIYFSQNYMLSLVTYNTNYVHHSACMLANMCATYCPHIGCYVTLHLIN